MKTEKEIKEYLEANQSVWELGGMDSEENIRFGAEIELLKWILEEKEATIAELERDQRDGNL